MQTTYAELEADVYYLAGQKGQFESALTRIAAFEAEADAADRLRARYLRASILLTIGNVREAVPLYQEVLDFLHSDPRLQAMACVELLYTAQLTGDFALGEQVVTRYFTLDAEHPEAAAPSHDRILVQQGTLLQLQGKHREATECFKQALQRLEDPDHPTPSADRVHGIAFAWYGLALSYIAMGDSVKARFAIGGIGGERRSSTVQALIAMAEFYLSLHLGNLDLAAEFLDKAEEQNDDPDRAQEILLGRARIAARRRDQATLAACLEQLQVQPYLTHAVRRGLAELQER